MPPPRAEEVEDSDSASDSADSASDCEAEAAAPAVATSAVAPSAVVTAEAASARAAALAEQLAARTGTVPVEGTASPGRPKETAAPGDVFFFSFGRWMFLQVFGGEIEDIEMFAECFQYVCSLLKVGKIKEE